MIDRVGGVEKIDWIKMYNSFQFRTSNESILIYIANEILKGDIYEYFVNNYNLRIDGVKFIKVDKNHKLTNASFIVLKWDINNIESKERVIQLGKLISNKRDWWHEMTSDNSTKRGNIVDYDKLLNGRDENEVLPNRCPIDNNIILNYTSIDFSGGNQNKNECKNNTDLNETWSAASIDRIDSTKEYAYDNIQIISYYYNSLKNCGSFEQLDKLYKHQSKIKSELYPIEYMI
jgi:hypothetical protein